MAIIFTAARLGRHEETLKFLRAIKPQSDLENFYVLGGIAVQEGKPFVYTGSRTKPFPADRRRKDPTRQ